MKFNLLTIGLTLLSVGAVGLVLNVTLAFFSNAYPNYLMFVFLFFVLVAVILVIIDCHNDLMRQKRIYDDLEMLIYIYRKRQASHDLYIAKLLKEIEECFEKQR